MDRFSLLFCLATFLLASTEAALDAEGIVGGDIADDDKYKYQISIQYSDGFLACGGAIIDDWHVLTAAHCFTDSNGHFTDEYRGLHVVAGALDVNNTKAHPPSEGTQKDPPFVKRVGIKKVYIPREYKGYASIGDIAVLKLNQSLNLRGNERLEKVELPNENVSYVYKNATITGFGYTKMVKDKKSPYGEKGSHNTFKKKFATAKVLSNAGCREMWKQDINPKKICAKMYTPTDGEKGGTCSGDSGGPLVYDDSIIIGILSTSPRLCDERIYSAIYTNVSAYLDFINYAVAGSPSPDINEYEYTKPDKYNYLVSLRRPDDGSHYCGGAIIDSQYVLTAIRCITDDQGRPWSHNGFIVAGTSELFKKTDAIRVDIDRVYFLTSYKGYRIPNNIVDDIAVVKLSKPLNLGAMGLGKVELPKKNVSYVGKAATISGVYDTTMEADDTTNPPKEVTLKKKYAHTKVVSPDDCRKMWNMSEPLNDKKICVKIYPTAQANFEGVYGEDIGGPLVDGDRTIIGILSNPPCCNEKIIPAVYTKVFDYLNFINDVMNGKIEGSNDYVRIKTNHPFPIRTEADSWKRRTDVFG